MNEHTPGPWSFDSEGLSMGKIREPNRAIIAEVVGDSAIAEANGYLLAAAPDLLEALHGLLDAYQGRDRFTDEAARAIAKAEGRP